MGPADPAEELLDLVDADDRVTGQARRGEVYARGLRHRCVFVLVTDADGKVFVHRRTASKLVFPSLYDMFTGGVVGAGESYDDAALREAREELGVAELPPPTPLFRFLYEDGARGLSWWAAVYEVRCALPVRPQREEVAWHTFLSRDELRRRLTEWEWVPDGLAAYQRLLTARGENGADGADGARTTDGTPTTDGACGTGGDGADRTGAGDGDGG
ncbi:NTP pyrophosphohydrolase [Streptomyces clavuligerus]|nr:NUDIX domain-containing protein [Streptomyces clavuligerus]ANW20947.1 NTP pyrophosphohydrolase [Streptomyces clavuligerus]WDN55375.1 NUDIX domain-containing protein [Streptomyces clavuligerus]